MVYCSRGFHSIVIWLHCSVGCNEENLMVRRVWLGKVTSEGLGNREMDSKVWPLVIQTSAIRPHNEKFWYLSTGQRLRSHPVHWLGGWGLHIQTQYEVRGWSNGPRVNSGTESLGLTPSSTVYKPRVFKPVPHPLSPVNLKCQLCLLMAGGIKLCYRHEARSV